MEENKKLENDKFEKALEENKRIMESIDNHIKKLDECKATFNESVGWLEEFIKERQKEPETNLDSEVEKDKEKVDNVIKELKYAMYRVEFSKLWDHEERKSIEAIGNALLILIEDKKSTDEKLENIMQELHDIKYYVKDTRKGVERIWNYK